MALNLQHRLRFSERLTRLARKARKALGNAVLLLQELLTPCADTAAGQGEGLYYDLEFATGVNVPASMRGAIEDVCRGRRWTAVQVGDCGFVSAYLHVVRGEPDAVASQQILSDIAAWLRARRRLPLRRGKMTRTVVGMDANV